MKGASIIIRKELKRVFGDKKLIFSLFILPAVLVIGIYFLMGELVGGMEKDISEHISEVYIVNKNDGLEAAINASGYKETATITYLSDAQYADREEDLRNRMLDGDVDLIVVLETGFESKLAAYSKAGDAIPEIKVLFNSTENYSAAAYSTFGGMVLDSYRNSLLAARLGNLEMLNVFTENDEQVVREEKANTEFFSMMLPYFITMLLFAGAMSVGVDAIAGEKERGTLASMLLSPVQRRAIVTGKLVSMAILTGLSAVVYSVAMITAMPLMGEGLGNLAEEGFGALSFSPLQCVELLAIMLSMVYLYVSIIAFLAVLSKDTKTASAYISPCYIAVIVAGMMTMFISGKDIPMSRYAIPIYGNALAIRDLCGNELALANFGVSILGTLACGIILTVCIVKAFNSEKIMFNA